MVKTGDIVKVKVLEVDPVRKRISLSMKLGDPAPHGGRDARGGDARGGDNRFEPARAQAPRPQPSAPAGTAMAGAFAKLQGLRK